MSSTVSVDCIFDVGPESFFQEKYQPSLSPDPQYVHTLLEIEEKILSLPERRIQWLKDEGIFSTWVVDSAVQMQAPSHAFCQHQTSLWKKIYNMNNSLAELVLLAGAGFAMLGVGLRLDSRISLGGALMTIGLTLVITGISAGFFAFREYCAAQQFNSWNRSPVQELANQRMQAYKQGFPYIYNHHLKRGGLHPIEVKAMYEKYFSEFCKNLLSQGVGDDKGREQWMRDFLNMNPLSSILMQYGLGNIPDSMKAFVDNYTHNFSLSIENLESLNGHEATQLLDYYRAARELLARAESAWNKR